MSSSISVKQVLANHANSSSPARAALETILSERNNLRELAIVEPPQRTAHSYSLASNDVKRLRAGRDRLRAKLETLTKGKEVSDDKNLSASTSASSGPGHSSDEANRDASNDVSGKPSESGSSSQARPTRHQSEWTPSMHFVPDIHIAR